MHGGKGAGVAARAERGQGGTAREKTGRRRVVGSEGRARGSQEGKFGGQVGQAREGRRGVRGVWEGRGVEAGGEGRREAA